MVLLHLRTVPICQLMTLQSWMLQLIGQLAVLSTRSRIKDSVAHVGPSQQWELWKVHGKSTMAHCILWRNSNWLIATNPMMAVLEAGLTQLMTVTSAALVIVRRTLTRTLHEVARAGHRPAT